MTKRILVFIGLYLLSYNQIFAQDEELIGFDFTHVGSGKTDNEENISYQKYDVRFQLPVELKKRQHYLMHGLSLGKSRIHYGKVIDTKADVNTFHTLSYSIGYTKLIKNDWFFYGNIGPYVSSNFESGLRKEEIQFTGMLLFYKELGSKKQFLLSLGAMYHPGLGLDAPIPFAGIEWKPNDKWKLAIGFPEFSVDYNITKSTILGGNLFMTGDQVTLSKKESISNSSKRIDHLSYTDYGLGFHIKQRLLKNFELKINSGYTFYRKLKFEKGNKTVVEMEPKDRYFVQVGISFLM